MNSMSLSQPEVGADNSLIVRVVAKVNRSLTPQQLLEGIQRVQHVDDSVVATMPRGNGEGAKVSFFNVGCNVTNAELENEYRSRGLKPADGYSLAAVNEEDPAFADESPNATVWKDGDGNWCFISFSRFANDERVVTVDSNCLWDNLWLFAGIPE